MAHDLDKFIRWALIRFDSGAFQNPVLILLGRENDFEFSAVSDSKFVSRKRRFSTSSARHDF